MRGLRPLKDELGFAQRRTEELGRRLVEQDAAVQQFSTTNEQLQAKVDGLLTVKQQLELALATARSSVTAQEQVVASMLERFNATAPALGLAVNNPDEVARRSVKRESKKSTGTGTYGCFCGFYMNPCRPSIRLTFLLILLGLDASRRPSRGPRTGHPQKLSHFVSSVLRWFRNLTLIQRISIESSESVETTVRRWQLPPLPLLETRFPPLPSPHQLALSLIWRALPAWRHVPARWWSRSAQGCLHRRPAKCRRSTARPN